MPYFFQLGLTEDKAAIHRARDYPLTPLCVDLLPVLSHLAAAVRGDGSIRWGRAGAGAGAGVGKTREQKGGNLEGNQFDDDTS